jgi:hypothetical protein
VELMRFLPKGLNFFKIQTRFKMDWLPDFCNSKSIEILEVGQKGKL